MTYQEYLASHPDYSGMTHMPFDGRNAVGGINSAIAQYLQDVASGRIAEQGMARYGNAVKEGIAGNYGLFGDVLGDAMGGGLLAKGIPGLLGVTRAKGARQAIGGLLGDAKSLPMDEASRMTRAKDMGYEGEDLYHGTDMDFAEFSKLHRGKATKAKSAKSATWLVDNPETAAGYADYAAKDAKVQKLIDESYAAERRNQWDKANSLMRQAEELEEKLHKNPDAGQTVMPLLARGKMMEFDAKGRTWADLDENTINELLSEAKNNGYDGLKLLNLVDEAAYGIDTPATHYAIFDPKNIRSKFAKFDPSKKDSADLLASYATLGLLGGAGGAGLLQPDQTY